jgi:hypothetical protein
MDYELPVMVGFMCNTAPKMATALGPKIKDTICILLLLLHNPLKTKM